MPLDMDALGRVIAQAVKEEVGRIARDDADIRAENEALRKDVEALKDQLAAKASVDALAKTSEDIHTVLTSNAKALADHLKRLDGIDETHVKMEQSATERLKDQDEAIQGIKDHADETRSMARDAHNEYKNHVDEKLKDMGGSVENLVKVSGGLNKDVSALKDSASDIEQKQEDAAKAMDDLKDAVEQIEVVPGPAGKDGADGVDGRDGKDGIDGKDGADGVDGKDASVDFDFVRSQVIKYIDDNQAAFGGEQGEKGDPGPAGEPTELQVLTAVKALWPDVRALASKNLPKMEHRGVYDPDTQYDVGDEVIKAGSTYRMVHKTDEEPGNDADGWQMISQGRKGSKGLPGKDGDQGEKGDQGPAGVGIDDMIFTEGMFVISLTDGETKEFDLTEFIELIIKAIGER